LQDLQPLFEKYGDVGDVYIPLERGSGRSRGFAFVRYYDKRDAEVSFCEDRFCSNVNLTKGIFKHCLGIYK
jgi:hypothetical protein